MGTLGDSTEPRPLKIDFIIFVPHFRLHWELVDCELKFITSMCCYVDRPMDSESQISQQRPQINQAYLLEIVSHGEIVRHARRFCLQSFVLLL